MFVGTNSYPDSQTDLAQMLAGSGNLWQNVWAKCGTPRTAQIWQVWARCGLAGDTSGMPDLSQVYVACGAQAVPQHDVSLLTRVLSYESVPTLSSILTLLPSEHM